MRDFLEPALALHFALNALSERIRPTDLDNAAGAAAPPNLRKVQRKIPGRGSDPELVND
jgi:hypothetical protein